MIDDDFPQGWEAFVDELQQYLASSEYHHVMGALVALYEVAKKFQCVVAQLGLR